MRELENDLNENTIEVENLDLEQLALVPMIKAGRHEVKIEKVESVRHVGTSDKDYDKKDYDFTDYRVFFRIIENGVKSEVYYAKTLNKMLVYGIAKLIKEQGHKFMEIEINEMKIDCISKSGKEYEKSIWELETIFPIDNDTKLRLEKAY